MKVVLISTYELGRQPFGLASPAAWLRAEGVQVTCLDLSQVRLDLQAVREADLVAIYLPMHTATRIALNLLKKIGSLNPGAHVCAYGLYAPLNSDLLKKMGVNTILGGEFEEGLLNLARSLESDVPQERGLTAPEPLISLKRLRFIVPDRYGLPVLERYAQLILPSGARKTVGYTEASRGCKHFCRHCPIVPVYGGIFRVVQREVVLEDIRRQVARGAEHITFGDPDFFNGIRHAAEIVRAVNHEFPDLTYDVTIKVEHLRKHADHLQLLKDTGCAFVVSAVEAVDDRILEILDKGHTREDFVKVVALCREVGLALAPTFVAFTPWISLEGYEDLLEAVAELDLIEHVSPVQLAIRLLIPAGSRLLESPAVRSAIGPFDERALTHRWQHIDPRVDILQRKLERMVKKEMVAGATRREIFHHAWTLLQRVIDHPPKPLPDALPCLPRSAIPYLNEPWYC